MSGRAETLRRWLAAAPLVAAVGCAVGPDFEPPAAPAAATYTPEPQPTETAVAGGRAQRFAAGNALPVKWWELFESPRLDERVEQALAANPTLQSAQATLRQSENELRAGYSVFFPRVDVGASAVRERTFVPAPSVPRETLTVYSLAANASYVLDVFGGERRKVESERAQTDTRRYETAATYVTLVATVANTTIAEAAYREQIDFTQRLIDAERDQVAITQSRARSGLIPRATLLALETQLASTESQIPQLEQRWSEARDLLAVLLGREPASFEAAPVPLAELVIPQEIPVSLPSDLVRQRPDVLAAEARLHGASADIGVATAAMFPQITLSGSYGTAGTGALFSGPTAAWYAAAQLVSPVFHAGELWFQRRAAIEAYQASLASYRETVLGGLEQVADSLRALEHDAAQVEAQRRQESAALDSLQLVGVNYRAGLAGYLDVLVANFQANEATIARIEGEARRLQDTVTLFAALGGGWWEDPGAVAPP